MSQWRADSADMIDLTGGGSCGSSDSDDVVVVGTETPSATERAAFAVLQQAQQRAAAIHAALETRLRQEHRQQRLRIQAEQEAARLRQQQLRSPPQ